LLGSHALDKRHKILEGYACYHYFATSNERVLTHRRAALGVTQLHLTQHITHFQVQQLVAAVYQLQLAADRERARECDRSERARERRDAQSDVRRLLAPWQFADT
jgi:hypothetical protein